MKMIFGLVGLLIVLAIVGSLAKTQLRLFSGSADRASQTLPPPPGAGLPPGESPNVPQQSVNLQSQVRDRVNQTLQQGADRSASDPQQ